MRVKQLQKSISLIFFGAIAFEEAPIVHKKFLEIERNLMIGTNIFSLVRIDTNISDAVNYFL